MVLNNVEIFKLPYIFFYQAHHNKLIFENFMWCILIFVMLQWLNWDLQQLESWKNVCYLHVWLILGINSCARTCGSSWMGDFELVPSPLTDVQHNRLCSELSCVDNVVPVFIHLSAVGRMWLISRCKALFHFGWLWILHWCFLLTWGVYMYL